MQLQICPLSTSYWYYEGCYGFDNCAEKCDSDYDCGFFNFDDCCYKYEVDVPTMDGFEDDFQLSYDYGVCVSYKTAKSNSMSFEGGMMGSLKAGCGAKKR